MVEPQREVLRLNRNESAVLGELARLELGVPEQRLTRTYRRILELSRSNDPIDGILVAHLVREFLAAFAFNALGNDLPRGRLEYRERVGDMAVTWPADVRGQVPSDATIAEVRRLLNDHDATSERAGNLAGATFQRGDRVSAGYVPDHSTKRWLDLSRRSSGFAHRIKNLGLEMPTVEEGRRIVDELTATLLAAVGPFLTGVDEIDRFLLLEAPDRDAANGVAALLRTPAQESYFFDRAGEQWLEPLAAIGAILTSTPPLIAVGEGYVAPGWPQGRFLARAATSDPDLVLGLLGRIQHRDNPQVVTGVVRVAQALPADHARQLTDQVARWVRVPLVLEYAAVETAALARDLAIAGFAREGATLLMAVVKAAAVNARDSDWHLEQALGDPVEAIVGAGGDLAHPLRTVLKDLLRKQGHLRRYS